MVDLNDYLPGGARSGGEYAVMEKPEPGLVLQGSRVRVIQTSNDEDDDQIYDGKTGVVEKVDANDLDLPYLVRFDHDSCSDWVYLVACIPDAAVAVEDEPDEDEDEPDEEPEGEYRFAVGNRVRVESVPDVVGLPLPQTVEILRRTYYDDRLAYSADFVGGDGSVIAYAFYEEDAQGVRDFSFGDSVEHDEWGQGVVTQVDEDDESLPYYVRFLDGEEHWCSADRLQAGTTPPTSREDAWNAYTDAAARLEYILRQDLDCTNTTTLALSLARKFPGSKARAFADFRFLAERFWGDPLRMDEVVPIINSAYEQVQEED